MADGVKSGLKVLVWVGSIAMVFAIGIYFFPREYPELGLWESIYVTIRLFVFERDQAEFPHSWPLIVIYFLAPAIAVSAAGTAVSYLFKLSPAFRIRWMYDHVVVCGVGRAGKLIASTIIEKGAPVVGVDLGPADDFAEWRSNHRLPMLFGDFHNKSLLDRAGIERARSVVFASGDDLANLEGAITAYEMLQTGRGPVRLIWTHIANEKLAQTARNSVRTEGKVGIRFFDTYRIAAVRMIGAHFNKHDRAGVTEVNILGFGKFGRDLFEIMVADLSENENFTIRVIDKEDRGAQVKMLAEELGVAGRVKFKRAAIQELDLVDAKDHAYFLCTDDDLGNLTAAMMLAGKSGGTHIHVRMARWPLKAVSERLGQDCGVAFININELVAQGIEDLPGVFEAATEKDLKRLKVSLPERS